LSSAALKGFFFARADVEGAFFDADFLLLLVGREALDFCVWETQNGEHRETATANKNSLDLILTTSV
jgi:hypothetical protein